LVGLGEGFAVDDFLFAIEDAFEEIGEVAVLLADGFGHFFVV